MLDVRRFDRPGSWLCVCSCQPHHWLHACEQRVCRAGKRHGVSACLRARPPACPLACPPAWTSRLAKPWVRAHGAPPQRRFDGLPSPSACCRPLLALPSLPVPAGPCSRWAAAPSSAAPWWSTLWSRGQCVSALLPALPAVAALAAWLPRVLSARNIVTCSGCALGPRRSRCPTAFCSPCRPLASCAVPTGNNLGAMATKVQFIMLVSGRPLAAQLHACTYALPLPTELLAACACGLVLPSGAPHGLCGAAVLQSMLTVLLLRCSLATWPSPPCLPTTAPPPRSSASSQWTGREWTPAAAAAAVCFPAARPPLAGSRPRRLCRLLHPRQRPRPSPRLPAAAVPRARAAPTAGWATSCRCLQLACVVWQRRRGEDGGGAGE